jgi:hypothetical protein
MKSGKKALGAAEQAIWNLPARRPNHVWLHVSLADQEMRHGIIQTVALASLNGLTREGKGVS